MVTLPLAIFNQSESYGCRAAVPVHADARRRNTTLRRNMNENGPAMPEAVVTPEQEEALWNILLLEGPPADLCAHYWGEA